jgi:hypothetical protein
MAKIPLFNKTHLRYGAHFSVMTSFGEKAAPLAESESMLTAAYNAFKSALDYEDGAIKIARASEYSDQILKEDTKRDRLYNNGKATVEMWVALGIEPMATAAQAVLKEYNNYKVETTAQYDQETGLMLNFLQPFETAAMKEKLQTLGLTAVFEQMKIANEAVRSLISQRGDERAANAAFDIKKARQATDAAYDKLVERINALQVLDETGKYNTFIAWWSQEIARIKQQILNANANLNPNANPNPNGNGNGNVNPNPNPNEGGNGNEGGGSSTGDPSAPSDPSSPSNPANPNPGSTIIDGTDEG